MLNKAKIQLSKAEQFIDKMSQSKTLDEVEENWIEFLHHLERFWNKLTSNFRDSCQYHGWDEYGNVRRLRKKDELLSYIINARGADEHTISDISKQERGGIAINPAEGNSLHINKLEINDGNIFIDSNQNIKIDFIPDRMVILPVTNRGRTYKIPTKHLDIKIEKNSPIEMAKLSFSFYQDYFQKVEEKFDC